MFSQKGYSAASLQEIADRVGILKGSLYHYIDSKESLLFRILDGSHTSAMEIMKEVDALSLPTELKFVTYVERVVLWYLQHLDRAGLYQNEWRYLEGDFAQEVRRHRRNFNGYMRSMVDAAVTEGLAPKDLDAETATSFVLSAIDSIPSWFRTNPPADPLAFATSIAKLAHAAVFSSRTMPTA
ncbi:MAG: TetR/AcrR family transcriptional regulator [Microbacteriaceae bacterium]|nr:TetR/AcrR family transcriptional regulator [Microbacteriaceae bacterium]